MNKRIKLTLALFCLSLATHVGVKAEIISSVLSNNGQIKVEISLTDDNLTYEVFRADKSIIKPSKLGLVLNTGDYTKRLKLLSVVENNIDETYQLPSGKVHNYTNKCKEITATFERLTVKEKLEVIFRVYDEGIAFRYNVVGDGNDKSTLGSEISEFIFNEFETSWIQKYHNHNSWYYENRDWNANLSEPELLNTPALIKSGDTYMILTEAANYGNYAVSKLKPETEVGRYTFQPVGSVENNFPFISPWRVIMIGDLPTLVESTMIENLNPPTEIADVSWIKPGRSSWDWGGEDGNNAVGFDIAKGYIDLAERMGWEYFTLDDGWEGSNADYQLSDIVNYANTRIKPINVIVWAHQAKFQNNYDQITSILSQWKNIGVKGIKIDFWDDDRQSMMKKYDTLLQVAAEQQLLVNLHGCARPSGIRRRWPHLLTSEAVLGGEMYLGNSGMTPAHHNITLTMSRNVIGSMDYTPGDFGTKTGVVRQNTTWSHQMALLTAFESGLQYYIDCPRNYKYHMAESFLKRIPASWDEIKCLEAKPDSFVTLARRHDKDWFVAALCNDARDLNLDLSFLDPSSVYYAYVYKDGDCKSEIQFDFIPKLTNQSHIEIPMLKSGGVTIQLSEVDTLEIPDVKKYEAESKDNRTFGTKHNDEISSGGVYVGTLGRGNYLRFQQIEVEEAGIYAMTVFYMAKDEMSAYVKVNNETPPAFYLFNSSGGETGKDMGFMTILVSLNAGSNTIEFGNTQEVCPNLDRITIKRIHDLSNPSSISENTLGDDVSVTQQDGVVKIASAVVGRYTIYDLNGRVIYRNELKQGDNEFALNSEGVFIVNIYSEGESFSTKIIVKQ